MIVSVDLFITLHVQEKVYPPTKSRFCFQLHPARPLLFKKVQPEWEELVADGR